MPVIRIVLPEIIANLKKKNNIFNSSNATYNLSGAIKYIKLTEGSNTVMVVGNFDVVEQPAVVDFGSSGTWINVNGGSNINLSTNVYKYTLAPGEYHIYSKNALSN